MSARHGCIPAYVHVVGALQVARILFPAPRLVLTTRVLSGATHMTKPAFWIWLLSAPVLTGVFITAILVIPGLQASLGKAMGVAAIVAAVLSLPFSIKVAKLIS